MNKCTFCDYNQFKNRVIYEDDLVYVIHDKYPLIEGHLLAITKKHYENIMEMPDEELCHLIKVIKNVQFEIMKKMDVKGWTIKQNWQPFVKNNKMVIHHVHFHIIPRSLNDSYVKRGALERMDLSEKEINKIIEKIKLN